MFEKNKCPPLVQNSKGFSKRYTLSSGDHCTKFDNYQADGS